MLVKKMMMLIQVCFQAYTWRSSRHPAPKTLFTEWSDGLAHTDKQILNQWFDRLITHTDFDQAIIETSNGKDF